MVDLLETLTLADIHRARLAEAQRKWAWLERFAAHALYWAYQPSQRYELGAIDLDRVHWVHGKPTNKWDQGGLSVAQRAFIIKTRKTKPFDILDLMLETKKAARGL